LLGVWREDIEQYCRQRGLNPAIDRTNFDPAFLRNWLRQEWIPAMETRSPGFRRRLWQTAWLLRADQAALEQRTGEFWNEVLLDEGPGFLVLRQGAFLKLELAFQRRLVRKALSKLLPEMRDVGFGMVQRVVDFCQCPTASRQLDLGLEMRAVLEEGKLYLAAWDAALPTWMWPQMPDTVTQLELPVPGRLELPEGWVLRADFVEDLGEVLEEAVQNSDLFRTWIDLGEQKPPLVVRARRTGERIKPLGMAGKSIKVSDLMINEKIPQRARDRWPLVCTDQGIAWVPGCRMSEDYRLTRSSQRAVRLQAEKKIHPD